MKKGEIGEIEETKIEISTFIGLFREFHVILCFNSMKKCNMQEQTRLASWQNSE